MTQISSNGEEFEFERVAAVMEAGLRDTLFERIGPCSEQQMLDAHAAAHLAICGEELYIP